MNTSQQPHSSNPFAPPASGTVPPPQSVPGAPPPSRQPRKRFSSEQIVSIVLACAGVGVTLIGVVLLLAMAAREGILTPPVRVAGGLALAVALAAVAAWVRPRPGGRLGSVALLATGAVAAFFDVVAITRIYHWVPLWAGLMFALAVGGCAGVQAIRWNEKHLFHALVLSVAGLAPFLTGPEWLPLVAFLAILQLVGLAPELRQQWDATAVIRTVPVVLAATTWTLVSHSPTDLAMLGAASVVALIGMAGAVTATTTRRVDVQAALALLGSWMPLALAAARYDRPLHAATDAIMLVVALGGFLVLRKNESMVRLAALALAGASAVMLALCCSFGEWRALPFLAAAVALTAVQLKEAHQKVGIASVVLLVFGFVLQGTVTSYLDLFYRSRAENMTVSVPVAGVLFLAFAIVGIVVMRGKHYSLDYLQPMLAFHGAAGVLGLAMVVIAATSGSSTGFFLGHLVVTVLSFAIAALVLTAGLSRPRHLGFSMVWGLTLVACALVKLFFFDLHYMGTMTKAFTFMAAGLVLLAAGTSYARTYAVSAAARSMANRDQDGAESDGVVASWPVSGR